MDKNIDPMTTKHTPGPWRLVETDEGHEIHFGSRITSPGRFRAQHRPVEYEHSLFPDESQYYAEAVANARLIAAAPDLLEALEALVAEQNGPPLLGRHEASWREAMAKAEAAIAKAKGAA